MRDNRVSGLDSIRFVCALWVVFQHLTYFPLGALRQPWTIFNGTAAVAVFFVVSGLCIHYPFRNTEVTSWSAYGVRRCIRVAVPMVIFIGVSKLVGYDMGVMWTLICELIYYALYPLLRIFKQRIGWYGVTGVALVGAAILAGVSPHATSFHAFTDRWNWVIGLPLWISGCVLAEKLGESTTKPTYSIWLWRVATVLTGWIALVLHFHSRHVTYPWTMQIYLFMIFFWLKEEINYFQANPTNPMLESAGKWSYSLYLMHMPGILLIDLLPGIKSLPPTVVWCLKLGSALGISYIFYLVVEKPSHRLAAMLGKKLSAKSVKTVTPI